MKKAAEDAAAAAAVNEAIVGDVAFAAAQAATMGPSAKEMVLVEGRLVCWSHRKKKGKVWKCFDLSKEEPCCLLPSSTGVGVCGVKPSFKGGTSNGWDHLYRHHRATWLQLKKELGLLTGVGAVELAHIDEVLRKRSEDAKTSATLQACSTRRCQGKLGALPTINGALRATFF